MKIVYYLHCSEFGGFGQEFQKPLDAVDALCGYLTRNKRGLLEDYINHDKITFSVIKLTIKVDKYGDRISQTIFKIKLSEI